MSDYSSTATSNVYINGDQAEDVLDMLKAKANDYRQELIKIAKDASKGVGSKEWDVESSGKCKIS